MVKTLNEAAMDYARGMARFLGVPESDLAALAERYKKGMQGFAHGLEEQHEGVLP